MNARGTYRKAFVETTTPAPRGRENASINDVIPGGVEDANPESRDSPMCNCTSEVWPFGPSPNDGGQTESRAPKNNPNRMSDWRSTARPRVELVERNPHDQTDLRQSAGQRSRR